MILALREDIDIKRLFQVVGLVLLFILFFNFLVKPALKELQKYLKLKKNGVNTSGKVVTITESSDSDNLKLYQPTIEFSTSNGEKYIFVSPNKTTNKLIRVGSKINVIYDAKDPNIVMIKDKRFIVFLVVKIAFFILVFVSLLSISIDLLFK